MDNGPHSPVLVHHPTPPHILISPGNPQDLFPNSELFANNSTRTQTSHAAPQEEQIVDASMDQLPASEDDDREGPPAEEPTNSIPQSTRPENEVAQSEAVIGVDGPAQASSTPPVVPEGATEPPVQTPADSTLGAQNPETEMELDSPSTDPDPPPPPPGMNGLEDDVPAWVKYDEDTSEITEEELKNIEGTDKDKSALDVEFIESKIYRDVNDPEQRPVKKLRLSWTIKGVRGTKERPNYARVMSSPAAFVDGFYWHIKFFPRGNNSSSLSSYIKCTPLPPKPDPNLLETTFRVFQGPPDANLGEVEPVMELSTSATSAKQDEAPVAQLPQEIGVDSKDAPENVLTSHTMTSADTSQEHDTNAATSEPAKDWRISAQLGTVIYNPAEPRSGWYSSTVHQFNKHSDDWGWTNFPSGPYTDIHVRHRNMRKPLLQNDTLTIDAYVQIFEDPSQALWWSESDTEKYWDSKSLAGYFPFGTPMLKHSVGVAGLSALLLLKPFRDVLQGIDAGKWRNEPSIKPQPLISQLQIVLFLMRRMKKDGSADHSINLQPVLDTLDSFSEYFSNVRQFWEVLRRSIDLELEGDADAIGKLADVFDGPVIPVSTSITLAHSLKINVEGVTDVQAGIEESLEVNSKLSFPKFLTIDLNRQKFDTTTRQWKMLYNRVTLNEEIDLSQFSTEGVPTTYTLYGFAVHVDERVSGKAYSILRPNGPGTKWLAFEDGYGNQIFSYTKKRIQDFEGLQGDELASFRSTRQTAYVAMYIRKDCLQDYLPPTLEPYDEPSFDWIRLHPGNPIGDAIDGDIKPKRVDVKNAGKKDISVEVYSAARVKDRKGLLDMFNLRDRSQPFQTFTLPATTTYRDLRRMLATTLWTENVEAIRLWALEYSPLGAYNVATFVRPKLDYHLTGRKFKEYRPICLWLEVLQSEEDIRLYGVADPPEPEKPKTEGGGFFDESNGARDEGDNPAADGSDSALNLLFTETQERSPDASTPPGTVSTPSSSEVDNTIDVHPAVSDLVQDSVVDAVSATIASIPGRSDDEQVSTLDTSQERTPNVLENFDFDSFLNADFGLTDVSGTDRDVVPQPSAFEHGNLVEALPVVQQDSTDSVVVHETGPSVTHEVDADSAAVIAAIIAADVEAADAANAAVASTELRLSPAPADTPAAPEQQPITTLGEPQPDVTAATDAASVPPSEEGTSKVQPRPLLHIYGFIQVFDVEQQNFYIHSTFFAPLTADIMTTVRKEMGYDGEHEICVWQRERSCNTTSVSSDTTFDAIRFKDGVDLIVGKPLPEKTKERLLAEGKFVTPDSLSRYLWMKHRRHPVEAFTGTKELDNFGCDHFSGPMLNGRFHGENGKYITATGHTYEGPFVGGARQGAKGTITYQNGDTYTGSFHDNEKNGQGTFIQRRTGNRYVGGYQNDKRWGKGTMYYEVADEEGEMCQICYGEEMDALFYDCGHICACVDCARQVDVCPICRKNVREVVRMYRA